MTHVNPATPTAPHVRAVSEDDTRPAQSKRIVSLDIVRGIAMVLMAIDHVRVYSGLPAGGPTPGIFFTRWVTNYSAPIFVFLAGTGAYLYATRTRGGGAPSRRQLAGWLLTRGAWLILLELTVLRFAWTFNFDYAHFVMAGVLWAIGWSMIILAALIYLPVPAIAAIGLVIVAGHNLMDPHFRAIAETLPGTQWGWLLQILYFGGPIDIPRIVVLRAVLDHPVGRRDGCRLRVRRRHAMESGASGTGLLHVGWSRRVPLSHPAWDWHLR